MTPDSRRKGAALECNTTGLQQRCEAGTVELLAPAGNPETLDAAIAEGADAVYLGLRSFNARMRSANFAWNQAEAAVAALHKRDRRVYVTVNTLFEEREAERMYRFLHYLTRIGADAIIVQDLGVIRLAAQFFPELPLHASTQLNVASARAANILSRHGVKRAVLARELTSSEIRAIKGAASSQLEVFVHGALCASESGLCLFSSYLGGKSANRGACAQACRRIYTAQNPGAEKSGYFFSPKDLSLISHVPSLIAAGVSSFKIEGRMKSAEYVGTVTAAYRYVLDNYEADPAAAIETGKRILASDFGREKTDYWYGFDLESGGGDLPPGPLETCDARCVSNPAVFGTPPSSGATGKFPLAPNPQDLRQAAGLPHLLSGPAAHTEPVLASALKPDQAGGTGIYLGTLSKVQRGTGTPDATAQLSGGYTPEVGDSIRLHKKDDTGRVSHKLKLVEIALKGTCRIDIPPGFGNGDTVYLLQTKSMSKRYPSVLPADLRPYRKQPGDETLPILDLMPIAKNELNPFPEGIYAAASTVRDLSLLRSLPASSPVRPVRYILEANHETLAELLSGKSLGVPKRELFLSLDPFAPQALDAELAAAMETLALQGYTNWVANNPAHLGILRPLQQSLANKKNPVFIVGGSYLYTMNRWAASLLENWGVSAFIPPLENSRDNLEAAFEHKVRPRVLLTLFAAPPLFRLRGLMPESYDFVYFLDKEGGVFKLLSTVDGSYVLPETPFSLVDHLTPLKAAGFSRFLIDLTKTRVEKADLKQIMAALERGRPLPDTSRFNWKNGFFVKKDI